MGASVLGAIGLGGAVAAGTAAIGVAATAVVATAVVGAVVGGVVAAVTGGDIMNGVMMGGLVGGLAGAGAAAFGLSGAAAGASESGLATAAGTGAGTAAGGGALAPEMAGAFGEMTAADLGMGGSIGSTSGIGGIGSGAATTATSGATGGLISADSLSKGMLLKAGVDAVGGMAKGAAAADAQQEAQKFTASQKVASVGNVNPAQATIQGKPFVTSQQLATMAASPESSGASYKTFFPAATTTQAVTA